MKTGLDALREDRRFLEMEILKLISGFENRHKVSTHSIEQHYAQTIGESCAKTVGITIEVRV